MALAHGATPTQAAEKNGVHKRTVQRRLADPEFQRKLTALQAEMLQSTTGLMTAASAGSVRTLVLLQDPSMPPNVRRAAARDILGLTLPWREKVNCEERLAALENMVADSPQSTSELVDGKAILPEKQSSEG